eukprot:gene5404-5637_t
MADVLAWSQKSQYALARKAVFEQWRRDNDSVAILHPGPLSCASARHPPVPYPHCQVFVNHNYKIAYIRSPKEKYETQEQIATIWQDYFLFGFIRNPWNRAYSLYKDLTSTGHFSKFHGPLCHLQWRKFCQDPFAEVQKLHARGCMRVDELYSYWHMMDQYHCMVTPTGDWAVDFLGRVEAGDEDWRVVVEEMNRRRRPGVPEVQYSSYGVANAVSSAASAPPQNAEQQFHYRRRSEKFGYLPMAAAPSDAAVSAAPDADQSAADAQATTDITVPTVVPS